MHLSIMAKKTKKKILIIVGVNAYPADYHLENIEENECRTAEFWVCKF